jgi:uncharacterized protein YgiM (DUF1202 family)
VTRLNLAAGGPLIRPLVAATAVALLVAALQHSPGVGAQTASDLALGETIVIGTDGDPVNLRADAGLSAVVLAELPAGTTATVVDGPVSVDGYTWYGLDVDGTIGWSAGEFLASATTANSFAIGDAVAVNADVLNLRDAAGLAGGVVAELPTGTTATVLGGPESVDGYTWYQVETDAGSGWVAGEYLSAVTAGSLDFAAGTSIVVDADALNLRPDAGLAGAVIAELPGGTGATVIGGPVEADGYTWYQVETYAGTGWVAGEFLTFA